MIHHTLSSNFCMCLSPMTGVLAALNELRHCAPVSLRGRLGAELVAALGSVASVLLRYHQTRIVRESETLLFIGMCRAFVEVTTPLWSACRGVWLFPVEVAMVPLHW